jgi:hypothetical protein
MSYMCLLLSVVSPSSKPADIPPRFRGLGSPLVLFQARPLRSLVERDWSAATRFT